MHDVRHANKFGIVVYDWSNAKAIWANAHPMSSEELITKQAEMVYAQDPGVPGFAPRVWACEHRRLSPPPYAAAVDSC